MRKLDPKMYLLGYDIGSSSIKAALVDANTNQPVAIVTYPETEMQIDSPHAGWAEQAPEIWWENVVTATKKLIATAYIDGHEIAAIGISYQMHGLVITDKNHQVLRPSIIWCDSRAVTTGDDTLAHLGEAYCFEHMLNVPGNFTSSKLKWVRDHEPQIFDRVDKLMLPGDFIALKLSGEATTTISGLSEGTLWDFKTNTPPASLLEHLGVTEQIIPALKPTFSEQCYLSSEAGQLLGMKAGIPVGYRAGDQPNNAMSLGVLNPGEVAGTGGTSGVVYGVSHRPIADSLNRVNSFAHVNYSADVPNVGVLLCINGSGIQYRWIKDQLATKDTSYSQLESILAQVKTGAEGVRMLPFGNGAERILQNKNIGAHIQGLNFNIHGKPHLYRAALEGIAFSFVYGLEILASLGMKISSMRVGNDNLFQSDTFGTTIATMMDGKIEMVKTTGAVGAARGAGFAIGHFSSLEEAMSGNAVLKTYEPAADTAAYQEAYGLWKNDLERILKNQ